MAQRVFIKVVGFSDEERHAINTLFRVSEHSETAYLLWAPEAPEPARVALLDGDSWEARLEAESPSNAQVKMIWVGSHPPSRVWRNFPRPLAWPDVIQSLDALFEPEQPLDFDLGAVAPTDRDQSGKRALIVSASREDRLYFRARLALANLTQADDAESGAQALELAQQSAYDLAIVDFALADMDAWVVLKQLRQGRHPIPHLAMANAPRSLPDHVRAWLTGTEALFGRPPHPGRLHAWLIGL